MNADHAQAWERAQTLLTTFKRRLIDIADMMDADIRVLRLRNAKNITQTSRSVVQLAGVDEVRFSFDFRDCLPQYAPYLSAIHESVLTSYPFVLTAFPLLAPQIGQNLVLLDVLRSAYGQLLTERYVESPWAESFAIRIRRTARAFYAPRGFQ